MPKPTENRRQRQPRSARSRLCRLAATALADGIEVTLPGISSGTYHEKVDVLWFANHHANLGAAVLGAASTGEGRW